MSATVEKATRRDLRRAVGAETVTVVEDLIRRQDAQALSLGSLGERVQLIHNGARTTGHDLKQFTDAPFRARLRWLLTGKLP